MKNLFHFKKLGSARTRTHRFRIVCVRLSIFSLIQNVLLNRINLHMVRSVNNLVCRLIAAVLNFPTPNLCFCSPPFFLLLLLVVVAEISRNMKQASAVGGCNCLLFTKKKLKTVEKKTYTDSSRRFKYTNGRPVVMFKQPAKEPIFI